MVPDNPLGCKKIVRNAYEYTAKSCRRENRIDYIYYGIVKVYMH